MYYTEISISAYLISFIKLQRDCIAEVCKFFPVNLSKFIDKIAFFQ